MIAQGKTDQQDFIRREVQFKSQISRMKELLDKAVLSRGYAAPLNDDNSPSYNSRIPGIKEPLERGCVVERAHMNHLSTTQSNLAGERCLEWR